MQGRTVVLAILDRTLKDFEQTKQKLKTAALEWLDVRSSEDKAEKEELREQKETKIEQAEEKGDKRAIEKAKGIQVVVKPKKEVGFAWVDGVFWGRWLRGTYGVDVRETGPRFIINEQDVYLFRGHANCRKRDFGMSTSKASQSSGQPRISSRAFKPSFHLPRKSSPSPWSVVWKPCTGQSSPLSEHTPLVSSAQLYLLSSVQHCGRDDGCESLERRRLHLHFTRNCGMVMDIQDRVLEKERVRASLIDPSMAYA
jgi:hypothetical protein